MSARGWLTTGILLVLGATASGAATAEVDLAPLFAPPAPAEIAAVEADWAARSRVPLSWEVVETGTAGGHEILVVRHRVEDFWHYGAIRLPLAFDPGGCFPVVLLHHGGEGGLGLSFLLNFDRDFTRPCLRDSAIVAAPTYRGEVFNGEDRLGFHRSGGEPSPLDRDADDAMALLDGVLGLVSGADPARITQLAFSRGGGVAYHVAIRDPRPTASVIVYGPADFFLPELWDDIAAVLAGDLVADNPLVRLALDDVVEPFLAGDLALADARLALLRWSVPYYLRPTLRLQLHHGTADETVPIAHSLRVAQVMTARGATEPGFEFYYYEGAGHFSGGLSGWTSRAAPLHCAERIPLAVPGGPPPRRGPGLRAFPNPFRGRTQLEPRLRRTWRDVDEEGPGRIGWLTIYDLAGRHVRTLITGETILSGERHAWDGRDAAGRRVPVGTYLARLRTEDGDATVKLLRLR